ncbi:T9SS type B sorting domain-containing protein [Dyadobacter sandarakinus]|uniref:Gliding motility-associated C-terminal domain-containing protein n=1 Tax=Dyadobacter sandarakinus TaxID=2747268 RepID=A0ABX7I5P7_9BACT|nr:T9SS type B sorting domain-containing protein [Dyadobacter sandarakinus]QRR01200.1 gliding motility-associated C-terminal domain-containing protein [Dyadobacter sandarakinus]
MKLKLLLFPLLFLISSRSFGQIKHTYRFFEDLEVAKPECGPALTPVRAAGSCGGASSGGSFVQDVLPCSVQRKVYRNNLNWGLTYPNTDNAIADTYTIQMYVKLSRFSGAQWARIIDFSNGVSDQGIYFEKKDNNEFRFDFYPFGVRDDFPFLNTDSYNLITFTRNGATNTFDIYINNTLYQTYNDKDGRYVGLPGNPVHLFRDDEEVSCESGEFNLAYLSFGDNYSSQGDLDKDYADICATANINPYADFSISPNPACNNAQEVEIKYTGNIPAPGTGYTFQWDWGGGRVVSGTGMGPYKVVWNTTGEKKVTLNITNVACGNTISNTKQIIVSDLTVASTLTPGNCTTGQAGTLTVTGQKGTAPYQYSIDSLTFQAANTFQVMPAEYKVYVKDGNGCVVSKPVSVEFASDITVKTIADATICAGQTITLATTSNATGFSWSPLNGLDNAGAQNPRATPANTTTYIVIAQEGACTQRDTVTITVTDQIQLVVTPNSSVIAGIPFQLSVSSPQITNPADATYLWSPPEGLNDPTSRTPRATLENDQTYSVQVATASGCGALGSVTLTVRQNEGISLPTAFTPNGDGQNDIFMPILRSIASIQKFTIFNRWGQVVFHTTQMDQGWDGYFKGAIAAGGDYIWEIQGTSNEGKVIRKKGAVLLIR